MKETQVAFMRKLRRAPAWRLWQVVSGLAVQAFQILSPSYEGPTYDIGAVLGWRYGLSWMGLSLLVPVILLRRWWEGTLRYLPAAAWTVGVCSSISRAVAVLLQYVYCRRESTTA